MQLVINVSDYDFEWIKNAYGIPDELNTKIAKSIIGGILLPEDRDIVIGCSIPNDCEGCQLQEECFLK